MALLALPDDETTLVQHWTLSEDDLAIIVRRRRPHNRLGFAIQLCALRYPGRLLRPGELIPDTPLAFVAEQLQVAPEVLADYATRGPTRYEQLDALREGFGFTPFSRPLRVALQEWLLPIALTTTSGAGLARSLLGECRRRRIIVPGISSVERMVAQALLDAERHVAEHLTRGLETGQRRLLDALLLPHAGTNLSGLGWVRQPPGKPGRNTFAVIIRRLALLRDIGIDPNIAAGIHPERLRRLCQEGARLTAQHVRTLQATRRRATLAATILETIVTLTDDAVLMFDRLLGQMFRREQNSADTALKRDRRNINGKIRLLARLGDALLTAKVSGGDIGAAVEAVVGWDDLGREVDEARKLIRPDAVDPVTVTATNYPVLRQVGPLFIASFTFGAVPACHTLARAVAIMRDLHLGRLKKLPPDTPVAFIRQAWRRAIGPGIPDRRVYEFCVLVELRDRLRAGDMWVEGSRRYRAVEQQLIPSPVFATMRAAGPLPIPAPDTASAWLDERRTRLARRLAEVERKAETDALEDVQLSLGKLRISPLKAVTPDEADSALAPLYAHLPAIRITDLLAEVDRWTGFSQCFTHLQSGRVADEPRAILTAVLADATNLGHKRMAEACDLVTQRQLSWLASASASEAAQVLDGLLHHGADLHIEEHHVDGGGVSDHVFALCHLLGFRFAPRIPNIAARRLHLFNGIEPGPDIAPLVAGRIDEALIAAHWDDVLRLGTSIRTGVVSASIMLERLGSYPRANGLALALREIGRVERTLFTLDWIEQPEQRRRATRELNKGEAENALKRAIFFHRIGRIRDHALQAQTHRASALNLVAGAIVLWNTTYLQAARMHLASLGRSIPPDLLQHLSPLGWQHINLTGDYLWTDPDAPSSALRPLRQMHAVEGPAKP